MINVSVFVDPDLVITDCVHNKVNTFLRSKEKVGQIPVLRGGCISVAELSPLLYTWSAACCQLHQLLTAILYYMCPRFLYIALHRRKLNENTKESV